MAAITCNGFVFAGVLIATRSVTTLAILVVGFSAADDVFRRLKRAPFATAATSNLNSSTSSPFLTDVAYISSRCGSVFRVCSARPLPYGYSITVSHNAVSTAVYRPQVTRTSYAVHYSRGAFSGVNFADKRRPSTDAPTQPLPRRHFQSCATPGAKDLRFRVTQNRGITSMSLALCR